MLDNPLYQYTLTVIILEKSCSFAVDCFKVRHHRARISIVILVVLTLYPLFCAGEFVAQFKFTVLLMNNGPLRITSGPFDLAAFDSTHSLQDDTLKVYALRSK